MFLASAAAWAPRIRLYSTAIPTTTLPQPRVTPLHRVVQYKMILKQNLIPMQDDPENGRNRVGKPLGNAHQNAECRESDEFTNQRVFESQRGDRIQRSKPCGGVHLGRKDACRPGIPAATEEAAGRDPRLLEQGRRLEPGADYAADSSPCSDRESGGEGLSAAAVRRQIHARRRRAAGAGGPRARAVERAGDATHPEARICRIRQPEIHAVGGNLGGASVQLAEQRGVPEGLVEVR